MSEIRAKIQDAIFHVIGSSVDYSFAELFGQGLLHLFNSAEWH